jgi:PIN domain nuclease of toxin-antitoxin system
MRLLLDTHVLIWHNIDQKCVSYKANAALFDPENELYVIIVSI